MVFIGLCMDASRVHASIFHIRFLCIHQMQMSCLSKLLYARWEAHIKTCPGTLRTIVLHRNPMVLLLGALLLLHRNPMVPLLRNHVYE